MLHEKDILISMKNQSNIIEEIRELSKSLSAEPLDYFKHSSYISRVESTLNLLSKLSGETVLDVGCGVGLLDVLINENVVSLDISKEDLLELKKIKKYGIVRGDACVLPFKKDTFDIIMCTQVLQYVSSPYKALVEMNRVLKEEGRLILFLPNNHSLFRIWNLVRHNNVIKIFLHLKAEPELNKFTLRQINNLINKSGFTVEKIEGFNIGLNYLLVLYKTVFTSKLEGIFNFEKKVRIIRKLDKLLGNVIYPVAIEYVLILRKQYMKYFVLEHKRVR